MMNIQEAIKSLQNVVDYWTYKPSEVEAASIAIQALEKQMPYKIDKRIEFSSRIIYGTCKCGTKLYNFNNYCKDCGQKIDWGVE